MIAVGIIGKGWFAELDRLASEGWTADDLAEFQNEYIAAAATTGGLVLLLAILSVACFQLLVWATAGGEHGMLWAVRRHPYRTTAIATAVAALVIAAANIDYLLAPQAWSPRHFISLPHDVEPRSGRFWRVTTGSLSQHGDWLIIHSFIPSISSAGDSDLYRLEPEPHIVRFSSVPSERAAFLAFDCDQDRLAFVDYEPVADRYRIHVVDLTTLSETILPATPRDGDLYSLQWLPGGSLVIHYGDHWNGKEGNTTLQFDNGRWSREESDRDTVFDPRSRKALEFTAEGVRVVDLESSRLVASFSQEWVDDMMESLGGDPSYWLKLSLDGRFVLAGNKIYDRESQTTRNWQFEDSLPQRFFHAFTPRGHAVCNDQPGFHGWYTPSFLMEVPFGSRLADWLLREPVRLIDPATGSQVACTKPLWSSPNSVTLSHDGSRMAVFTAEGVYMYDVPAKFR